ncbi:hypothetical protein [Streptomyces cucumeris]|uniref:hypothetical protein n=1 Tax=Streptomyces cucumeris TaxID=2962890 RepID=UPI0020C9100F|nr:hypothetical protein [Streptomyces sp. NEAU-Y11]MCP9211379.1 hypothetical protein [Streptomyces sp. NEAU-Y11]
MAQHRLRTWTAAALAALVALTVALALGVTGLTPFGSSAEDEVPTADMPRIDHHDEALEQAREFRVRLATKGTPEQRKLARHVTAVVGIIFSKDGDVHIATDLTDSPQPGNAMDGSVDESPASALAWAYADWKESRSDATVNVYNAVGRRLASGVDL